MSYWRFMVKCFFTFVVFPLVFWVPFSAFPLWEYVISLRDERHAYILRATDGLAMNDYVRLTIASYWPAILFWILAFLIWATLTYLMWFRVPNRPTNRPQK